VHDTPHVGPHDPDPHSVHNRAGVRGRLYVHRHLDHLREGLSMNDTHAFLNELAKQEGRDPTPQLVADALGWDFDRASRVLEALAGNGLVTTSPAQRRMGDTHLDDWVSITSEGKAVVAAASRAPESSSTSGAPQDRWDRIDMPVLRELSRAAETDDGVLLVDEAADKLGLRYRDVRGSVDILKRTGFIDVHFSHDSGGEYSFIRLSEKALRATGLWPTPESALDRMIAALEAIAANTDEDEDNRGRARKILDGVGGAGRQVGISVMAAAISGQIPGV